MDSHTESFELGENPNFPHSSLCKQDKTSTRTRIAAVIVVAIALLFSLIAIALIAQLSNEVEADREENERLKSELESQINKTRVDMVGMVNTNAESAKMISERESKTNETRFTINGMRNTLVENLKLMSELESKTNRTRTDIDKTLGMRGELLKATGWLSATNELFYKRFHRRMNYNDSKAECERHGAQLVAEALRRPEEIKHMLEQGLIPKTGNIDIWIGYTDIEEEDVWEWIDGGETNNSTVQWTPGNPDNWETGEHCGEINRMRGDIVLINDAFCDEIVPSFICEKYY